MFSTERDPGATTNPALHAEYKAKRMEREVYSKSRQLEQRDRAIESSRDELDPDHDQVVYEINLKKMKSDQTSKDQSSVVSPSKMIMQSLSPTGLRPSSQQQLAEPKRSQGERLERVDELT